MADKENKVVDLYETVKMYAPSGAKHHSFNEEVTVSKLLASKFEDKGFAYKPHPKTADTGKA